MTWTDDRETQQEKNLQVNNNSHYIQKTAGLIRYSCGILYMAFTFSYLFFLQGEVLAEAQHVYSKGLTTYHLFAGALISTIVLQLVQWVVAMLSQLPARWHALSYVPSTLLLIIFTDATSDVLLHFTFGAWIWAAPIVLLLYIGSVVLIRMLYHEDETHVYGVKSLMYPNYIILFVLILLAGSMSHTSDVYHYELKTERLILEGDYEEASRVGERSLASSKRLTQLRMYALSLQGQLPERVFDYPQYYGTKGLLDVHDTTPYYRVPASDICLHLGAICGSSVRDENRYFHLLYADSLANEHTSDYYLCMLLLKNDLKSFCKALPRFYRFIDEVGVNDSLPVVQPDSLPRAYREALLVYGDQRFAHEGKVVVGKDTIAIFTNSAFIAAYNDYCYIKASIADELEKINRAHRAYGHTYWWYHDYSKKAQGLLAPRKE